MSEWIRAAAAFSSVLTLHCALMAQSAVKQPAIPTSLLAMVRNDLDADDAKDCLEEHQKSFEQIVSTEWLKLNMNGAPAFLVVGIGPCFNGVNKNQYFIYAQFGREWRMMLDDEGSKLAPLKSLTRGWRDVEVWRHEFTDRSTRLLYHFDKTKRIYRQVSCEYVQDWDFDNNKPLAKPIREPCN